jgi:uncharacterized protein YqgC (DUF456 family)
MEKSKTRKIIRIAEITGGTILIVLGIVGLILPILQGFLFIFAGIILLFPKEGKKIIRKIKKFFKNLKK